MLLENDHSETSGRFFMMGYGTYVLEY